MENKNVSIVQPRVLLYLRYEDPVLTDYLVQNGYSIINVNENNILNKIREGKYDLCLFDHLPGEDNLRHVKYVRNITYKMPVVILSDDTLCYSILQAFAAGVDDYITKPYNIEELVLRLKAILRRCGLKLRNIKSYYNLGKILFDVTAKELIYRAKYEEEKVISLNKKQAEVLSLLCAYKNEMLPSDIILKQFWGTENYYVKRTLDVVVCRIRGFLKKLDPDVTINTTRGIGYSLIVPKQAD